MSPTGHWDCIGYVCNPIAYECQEYLRIALQTSQGDAVVSSSKEIGKRHLQDLGHVMEQLGHNYSAMQF